MQKKNNFRKVMIPVLCFLALAGCKNKSSKSAVMQTENKPLLLFIGTYTQKEDWVDGKAKGIYMYHMNPSDGSLTYLSTSPYTISPSFVAIHPNKKWLYAANEIGGNGNVTGTVSAFRIDTAKNQLYFINSVPSGGNSTCNVAVDLTGKYVFDASYGSGTVAMFPIQPDGSLKQASYIDQHQGHGLKMDRQASPHAHMLTQGFESRFAYGVDLGLDKIILYRVDTLHGKLIAADSAIQSQPGSGPRQLTFHPNRKWAYLINELNGTIEAFTVDSLNGELSRFQTLLNYEPAKDVVPASGDIHITPNGKFLYASNRGNVNNIAMYSIDPGSGRLSLIGYQSAKGKTPRYFVIDPTGTYLLVANQDSDDVVTFRIDPSTGKLIDTGIVTKIPSPVCLKFY